MEERSNEQQPWYLLEALVDKDGTWFAHLLVRWDELPLTEWAEEGERIGYRYTANRIVYALPEDAPTSLEELPIFIESIKDLLVTAAQNQLSQSEGLHGGN
jgi:hypothetical protein